MVTQNYQLNGEEFEQTLEDTEGQGSLASCNPCGYRVRQDLVTEQQNILLMADVSAKLRINYILFSLIERIVTDEKKNCYR